MMHRRSKTVGLVLLAAAAAGCQVIPPPSSGSTTTTPSAQTTMAGTPPTTVPTQPTAFPLHVASGNRVLLDAANRPFLLHGDTAWSLIADLTESEVVQYLDDRRSRGFNTILVNVLEHKFSSHAPNNAYGHPPFTTPGDFSTPNEQYFQHVDWVLQQAANRGFLVLLAPAYLGNGGGDEGWYQEMRASGTAKLEAYGRFIGQRYGHLSNVLWVQGGDFSPPDRSVVEAVVAGIESTDPGTLHTAHTSSWDSPLGYWGGAAWLDVNNVYTYSDVYPAAISAYQSSTMPYFLMESMYENEHDAESTPTRLRTQAYHALLSGATGQVFGNNPIWHFSGPGIYPVGLTWQQSLDSPGSRSMTVIWQLFSRRQWWTLQPDVDARFLTQGVGGGQDRAAAAVSSDRRLAVVYVPSARSITVDLGQLAGPSATLTWHDPANGATTAGAASAVPASGSLALTTPGTNSGGGTDWVLVVES